MRYVTWISYHLCIEKHQNGEFKPATVINVLSGLKHLFEAQGAGH